jgi:two-component SAPR family response regulator
MVDQSRCDFYALDSFLRNSEAELLDEPAVAQFVSIAGQGTLLANESFEWLDGLKQTVADAVDRFCSQQMKRKDLPPEVLLGLAETALIWDSLSETALKQKLLALTSMGRHVAAVKAYESFTAEYREIVGKQFVLSFSEIVAVK